MRRLRTRRRPRAAAPAGELAERQRQLSGRKRVNSSMRLSVVQVIAALFSAVCFVIAFIAAGVAVVSGAFMLLALAALGFIAFSALRRAFGTQRRPPAPPRPAGD